MTTVYVLTITTDAANIEHHIADHASQICDGLDEQSYPATWSLDVTEGASR